LSPLFKLWPSSDLFCYMFFCNLLGGESKSVSRHGSVICMCPVDSSFKKTSVWGLFLNGSTCRVFFPPPSSKPITNKCEPMRLRGCQHFIAVTSIIFKKWHKNCSSG
jgi:hypothetical protein